MTVSPKPALFSSTAMSFVCPGFGQAYQQRYVAAAIFFISWGGCALVMLLSAGKIIVEAYSLIDPQAEVSGHLPVIPLVMSLIGVILLWVVSLADTVLAGRRAARRGVPPAPSADGGGAAELPSSQGKI
ncbi:MAG: hypothetical protein RRC34_01680 [Lentisphaeria bacterium]|nr:hypothetical protein [Lentisphaeria bacterium]